MKHNTKRKGGRPKKTAKEKRCRVVSVKFTDDEYNDLKERARQAGVRISEFIRHGAFRLTIVSRLNELETKIMKEILHLSSDFNQAITWLNTFKLKSYAKRLCEIIDFMYEILAKLRPKKETDYVCKNP